MLDDGEFGEDFGVVHLEHALVCGGVSYHHQASGKILRKEKAERGRVVT